MTLKLGGCARRPDRKLSMFNYFGFRRSTRAPSRLRKGISYTSEPSRSGERRNSEPITTHFYFRLTASWSAVMALVSSKFLRSWVICFQSFHSEIMSPWRTPRLPIPKAAPSVTSALNEHQQSLQLGSRRKRSEETQLGPQE